MLQAAAELIVEKGWEATTAAEIGRRAGYSRALVHARFGGKDAILEGLQQAYIARLNPDPEAGATGLQQVLAHFDRVHEIHADDPAVTRAIFVAAFEAVKVSSPLREGVRAQLQDNAAKILAGVRTGMADGSMRSDIDADAAVRDITGAIFGIAYQWVVLPELHDLAHEIDTVRARIITTYGA